MSKRNQVRIAALLLAAVPALAPAQVANGSFETGDLTGWTAGGTGRVSVLTNANFRAGGAAAPMPAVPDGSRFAVLSTGPGSISSSGSIIDGNGANDFDAATLRGTLAWNGRPAVLIFDWTFASSEAEASPPYDDFFDVRINNNLSVFGGSVNASTSNTSTHPNVPVTGFAVVNWSINAGVVSGTSLTRGVGAWQRACIPIQYATAGTWSIPVEFRVADQADNTVDSALLIDNVRVQDDCDPNPGVALTQLTASSGSNVEAKGGGFVFRLADQRLVVANRDASTVQLRAFVSSANVDGSNPNLIEQVFVRSLSPSASLTRLNLGIASGGRIQALQFSDNGQYLVIAARRNAADGINIYRYRISDGSLITVTAETGCSNQNPVVSDAGTLVAFQSNCNALTGYGTTSKVVYRRINASTGAVATPQVLPRIAGCSAQNPALTSNGNFLGMLSTCNPPGRSNTANRPELFLFSTTGDNTAVTPVNTYRNFWRQVTVGTSNFLHYSLSLSTGGTGVAFTDVYGTFVSDGNLTGSNTERYHEIFRWRGNNSFNNNGSVVQVTNSTTAVGNYYLNVIRGTTNGDTEYFSFERVNGLTGMIEVGMGQTSTGGPTTVVASGSNFLGLGFAETGTEIVVPFVAAEDFNGGNADLNYEVWQGEVDK